MTISLFSFGGVNVNNLEKRLLIRYCQKYGVDFQEIDDSLTYWENKKHLRSLVQMLTRTLDVFEIERMAELQRQYIKEHALSYYIACQMAGETKSTETGQPYNHRFSLQKYIQSR